jgi:hypothetical protein
MAMPAASPPAATVATVWSEKRVMESPAQERRRVARHRTLKGARITFQGHRVSIDCAVRNLSDRGACLKVESPIGIPDTFDLVLDSATVRHCRVTWRKATQIGIEFA